MAIITNYICKTVLQVYVKVPLRVMYGKYSARGVVKWQIQHKAKPAKCCICMRPHPEYCIFLYITSKQCFNCWVGRISSSSSNECILMDVYKQIRRSDSLLPQKYKMEYIKYCVTVKFNLHYITINA